VAAFPSADPVPPLVFAVHVGPTRMDHVAFDRLTLERSALDLPVAQIAGFKVEVERAPIIAFGQNALVLKRQGSSSKEQKGDGHWWYFPWRDRNPGFFTVDGRADKRAYGRRLSAANLVRRMSLTATTSLFRAIPHTDKSAPGFTRLIPATDFGFERRASPRR